MDKFGMKQPVPKVKVCEGGLYAELELISRNAGESYTKSDVMLMLYKNNVTQGVDMELLDRIIENHIYNRKYVIAKGKEEVDGKNGYYEFYFRRALDRKPKILEDGSVDYSNIDLVEEVQAGQKIAKYTPATVGVFGFSVNGKIRKPKRGKELPRLTGKGFRLGEDGRTYYATESGGISMRGNQIIISHTYTIPGDLTLSEGNVNFDGDVHVVGDVVGNVKITATGNVTISGNVETANIDAGGNILLKKGMKGKLRGSIVAGGSIFGTYFEYTDIRCKGSISCNYLLGCEVYCEESITLQGTKSTIVDGRVQAIQGFNVMNLGNRAEKKTEIIVGVSKKFLENYEKTQLTKKSVEKELRILRNGKSEYEQQRQQNTSVYDKIVTAIGMKEKEYKQVMIEYRNGTDIIDRAQRARINILGTCYPGVLIHMKDVKMETKDERYKVTVEYIGGEIAIVQL